MYDFFYLPIDFKNKCNVGYAFINMLAPEYIIPLVERFDRRRWVHRVPYVHLAGC